MNRYLYLVWWDNQRSYEDQEIRLVAVCRTNKKAEEIADVYECQHYFKDVSYGSWQGVCYIEKVRPNEVIENERN